MIVIPYVIRRLPDLCPLQPTNIIWRKRIACLGINYDIKWIFKKVTYFLTTLILFSLNIRIRSETISTQPVSEFFKKTSTSWISMSQWIVSSVIIKIPTLRVKLILIHKWYIRTSESSLNI